MDLTLINIEPNSESREERYQLDRQLVGELFDEIEVSAKVEKITRLGKREENKTRPLMISLDTIRDKALVMENLKKLGEAPEHLKKLVVMHDLTPQQRKERKAMIAEASQKTEPNVRVVVRSAPGPRWDPKYVKLRPRTT